MGVVGVLTVLLTPTVASATIHTVNPGESIQAAINAATNGDTIVVMPGTYTENIDLLGKEIVLKSSDGAEVTKLQPANNFYPVVMTGYTQTRAAVFQGFTVTNNGAGFGKYSMTVRSDLTVTKNIFAGTVGKSAVLIRRASPNFVDNKVIQNFGYGYPGGIKLLEDDQDGLPTVLARNLITGNGSNDEAAGILASGAGDVEITKNLIYDNRAPRYGALHIVNGTRAVVQQNLIHDNPSKPNPAVELDPGSETLAGSVAFLNNTVRERGIAVGVFGSGQTVTFTNNVIKSVTQPALMCQGTPSPVIDALDNDFVSGSVTPTVDCGQVAGTNGNISASPLWEDPPNSFRLTSSSPVIDRGANAVAFTAGSWKDFDDRRRIVDGDHDGTATIDMGAYEFQG